MTCSYFIPSRILFGSGQLDRLHEQQLPGKTALIVISSGKSVKSNGYLDRLEEQLRLSGVTWTVFDKVQPNPVERTVMEGASLARKKGCDFVIGLGGGSTIDTAKAIAVMAVNDGPYWDYVSGGSGGGKPIENPALPVVAITTTAGTGTEADPFFVITKEETEEKIGNGFDSTFPVLSIVDPLLMRSVPPALTAYQGFDALFHSTEGYINRTANTFSDLYALKAIELLASFLPRAIADGTDMEAREQVAMGNTLAGMVESTSGCISEHSLEHAMSALHPKLPHGAGLIMISRAYYTHIAKIHACDSRMVDMAKAMGAFDAKEPMDFVEALVSLQKACGVDDLRSSDYGLSETEIPTLVANARTNMGGLFDVDPMTLSDEDCEDIYRASLR